MKAGNSTAISAAISFACITSFAAITTIAAGSTVDAIPTRAARATMTAIPGAVLADGSWVEWKLRSRVVVDSTAIAAVTTITAIPSFTTISAYITRITYSASSSGSTIATTASLIEADCGLCEGCRAIRADATAITTPSGITALSTITGPPAATAITAISANATSPPFSTLIVGNHATVNGQG
jgi:hypothetical protein